MSKSIIIDNLMYQSISIASRKLSIDRRLIRQQLNDINNIDYVYDIVNLRQSGIYAITNKFGQKYIGSSINIHNRFRQHKISKGTCQKISESMELYGVDNHVFEVILFCSIDNLLKYERFYQEKFNTLYPHGLNLVLVSDNNNQKYSNESLIKKQNTGRKVIIDNITYDSTSLASRTLRIPRSTIRLYCALDEHANFNFINDTL